MYDFSTGYPCTPPLPQQAPPVYHPDNRSLTPSSNAHNDCYSQSVDGGAGAYSSNHNQLPVNSWQGFLPNSTGSQAYVSAQNQLMPQAYNPQFSPAAFSPPNAYYPVDHSQMSTNASYTPMPVMSTPYSNPAYPGPSHSHGMSSPAPAYDNSSQSSSRLRPRPHVGPTPYPRERSSRSSRATTPGSLTARLSPPMAPSSVSSRSPTPPSRPRPGYNIYDSDMASPRGARIIFDQNMEEKKKPTHLACFRCREKKIGCKPNSSGIDQRCAACTSANAQCGFPTRSFRGDHFRKKSKN